MTHDLSRLITIVLFLAAGPAAAADIGRVLLAAGETVAVRGQQVVRLALGAPVQDRDVLRTGPASTLQVRFIDESLLAMRENSEVRIDEFRFTGTEDGSELGFFSLLKGGLRKVTGLVGRTNHKNYRMNSTVGTIGIRGTDYATTLCQQDCRSPDGSLARDGQYTRVIGASHGTNRVTYSNQASEREFGIGDSFFAADFSMEPQRLLEPPPFVGVPVRGTAIPPAGTGTEQAVAGGARQDPRGRTHPGPPVVLPRTLTGVESATDDYLDPVTSVTGATAVITPSAPAALGFLQALDYSPTASGLAIGFYVSSSMLTLSGSGASEMLTAYNIPAGTPTTSRSPNSFPIAETGVLTGSVVDQGFASSINASWGRWTAGNFTDVFGAFTVGPGGMHYMKGELAPPNVVASKTGTFSFSQLGGTTPTNNLGETPVSAFAYPDLTVNFTTRSASLTAVNWTFPSNSWNFPGGSASVVIKPQGAGIEGSLSGTCSNGACATSTPATLGVSGAFYGARGDHVGLALGATANTGTASNPTAMGVKLYSCAPSC